MTTEKLPAPRPSVSRTSWGTPPIHVPDEMVTATATTTIAAASSGRGRRAAKPSRIRGRASPAAPGARACTPAISTADSANETALTAKNALNGRNASRPAAAAQPPTDSASAVARTSPFACWTFARSTSAGRSAP
jgi:hypothetical protein